MKRRKDDKVGIFYKETKGRPLNNHVFQKSAVRFSAREVPKDWDFWDTASMGDRYKTLRKNAHIRDEAGKALIAVINPRIEEEIINEKMEEKERAAEKAERERVRKAREEKKAKEDAKK